MKIKSSICRIFILSFVSLLFLFSFLWIIFDFNKSPNSLKDTWTILSSLFGGYATLIAAYVATQLFNDWRDSHNANIKNNLIEKVLNSCDLHEANIFKNAENLASVKAKLVHEIKSNKNLIYRLNFKSKNNHEEILSIVHDCHSSFLWGKNIIWKHLLCLENEDYFKEKINIKEISTNLSKKSREISDTYLLIINEKDIKKKIILTDKLNMILADYLSFISIDIYTNLSSLSFEVKQD